MSIEHLLRLLLLVHRRPCVFSFLELCALRRRSAVRVNAEDLIEPETGQQLATPIATMHDMQMPVAKLFQPQRYARHRSHERRVKHQAILQVDDKFPVAAIHHLAREILEVTAVQEVALAGNTHPNGRAVHSYLY